MRSKKVPIPWLAGAVLGLATWLGSTGVAQASPLLQILDTTSGISSLGQETLGDAGGTQYIWPVGTQGPGAGLPNTEAGWPNASLAPGFATEPGFGTGISGYHGGYLYLSKATNLTFEFMGKGDATLSNQFWVNGTQLFNSATTPCGVGPGYTPSCNGSNSATVALNEGYVPFSFITGAGVTLTNNGTDGNPDTALGVAPGYFLGIDPYLTSGTFQTTGFVAYVGLSDSPTAGDHDFQDLGVRISAVPEPDSLALLGVAMGSLVLIRRRSKKSADQA